MRVVVALGCGVAGGYQFWTRPAAAGAVRVLVGVPATLDTELPAGAAALVARVYGVLKVAPTLIFSRRIFDQTQP